MARITTPYQRTSRHHTDMVHDNNLLTCTNNLSTEIMQQLLAKLNKRNKLFPQHCWSNSTSFLIILLISTNSEKIPQAVTYGRKEL